MTKAEFLYEHDLDSVVYLIEQHAKFHGMGEQAEENNNEEYTDPREFFSI